MNVSVRSYLLAGAAAATAATLTLTGVQVAPQNVAVPAHPVSAQPQLSQAMVDLLAAASRLTAAFPEPPSPPSGDTPTIPPVVAAPTAFAIAPGLANTIDNIYITVEPWVRYGFELGAYALGWVPYVGGWAGGLLMDGYNFGESLVASGVFNITDFLRGDGGIINNLVDFGVDVAYAFVWLGIDVASTFIPLPPLPWYPPRPPVEGPFLAAAGLAAPTAIAGSVNGDVVPPAVQLITNAMADVDNLLRSTSQGITDAASKSIEQVLRSLGLAFVNHRVGVDDELLDRPSSEGLGLVDDEVSSLPVNVAEQGQALGAQIVDSVVDHESTLVDTLRDPVKRRGDIVRLGIAAKDAGTSEVSSVPKSTRALLGPVQDPAEKANKDGVAATDAKADEGTVKSGNADRPDQVKKAKKAAKKANKDREPGADQAGKAKADPAGGPDTDDPGPSKDGPGSDAGATK
jgi:hypothetical protein